MPGRPLRDTADPRVWTEWSLGPFHSHSINVLMLVDFSICFTNFHWSILSKIYCTYEKITVCIAFGVLPLLPSLYRLGQGKGILLTSFNSLGK